MKQKIWQNRNNLSLFILGTYGERLFSLLHTLIKEMPSDLFCAICLIGFATLLILSLDE